MRTFAWAVLLAVPAPSSADPLETIEGLPVSLLVPDGISKEKPASLLVALHGNGGNGEEMTRGLAAWKEEGYVVCAPKSTGLGWSAADVRAVLRIAARVKATHPIDPRRVHVLGFSNGGFNLAPLAFDDELRPCSATWVAAGFTGGSAPKWAPKGLGVLALAGEQDPNARVARETVRLLRDKVRSAEVRLQPGVGHAWPTGQDEYLRWWMGVQEGRFVPGVDRNFAWEESLEAGEEPEEGAGGATPPVRDRTGVGTLVYCFDPGDAAKEEARSLQNEVFTSPLVRRFGSQLRCVKLDLSADAATPARLGVTSTPAVVLLKPDGSVAKAFEGKVKASALAAALRQLAPDRSVPKDE